MVKGVARRVIVLKSPDPRLFEEAIFLLREDAYRNGDSSAQVLKEAQKIANNYLLDSSPRGKRRKLLSPFLFTLLGGGIASTLWLFLLQLT